MWVNQEDFVTYIWDGVYWIGITADESAGIIPDPQNYAAETGVRRLREKLQEIMDRGEGVIPYEEGGVKPDGSHLDLSNETAITFVAVGSELTLYRDRRDAEGSPAPHYKYNVQLNELVLTEAGRKAVYEYAFFNPEQSIQTPRINYELTTFPNNVKGLCCSSTS